VKDNPDKPWNWKWLSQNAMIYQKKCWTAVSVIENKWLEKMYEPSSNYVIILKEHFEKLSF